jgi:hypothetical protein
VSKRQLALQLRQRQYALGKVERHLIDSLSDDEIIDSYVTCSHCGKKQVEGQRLEAAVVRARSAEDFLRICNEASNDSHGHPFP